MASANGSKSKRFTYFWSSMFFSKIYNTNTRRAGFSSVSQASRRASKEKKVIAGRIKDKTSAPTFVGSVLILLWLEGGKVRDPTLVAEGSGGLAHALRMLI